MNTAASLVRMDYYTTHQCSKNQNFEVFESEGNLEKKNYHHARILTVGMTSAKMKEYFRRARYMPDFFLL